MNESEYSNLLPNMKADNPQLMAMNRSQHLGAAMLSELTSDHMSPALFALDVFDPSPSHAQQRALNVASLSNRALVLGCPGAGLSQAGAMLAIHRLLTHRNHRVLIVSPDAHMFTRTRSLMKSSQHSMMITASPLFSIQLEDGFWATDEALWGIGWQTMAETPVHHVSHMIERADTIIVDNAHRYRPDFIRLLEVIAGDQRQVIFFGRDANTALAEFENSPDFETVRISAAQTPLLHAAYINSQRYRFQYAPELYEKIYQVAYDWEPRPCRA